MALGSPLSCIGEVYSPRDWDGLEYFFEDLRLSILHLDSPWDFDFEITSKIIKHFDQSGKLLYFNPWEFSDSYAKPYQRINRISPLINELSETLSKAICNEFHLKIEDKANNIIVKISVKKIKRTDGPLPLRQGVIVKPTLTGYAPELMFTNLVKRRLNKKIKKKQAYVVDGDYLRVLFVDVTNLGYLGEFNHPYYQKSFTNSITKYLDSKENKIDTVIFYLPNQKSHTGIKTLIIYKQTSVSIDKITAILGNKPKLNRLTDEVLINVPIGFAPWH